MQSTLKFVALFILATLLLVFSLTIADSSNFSMGQPEPAPAYIPLSLGTVKPIEISEDGEITDEGVKGTTGKTPAVKGEEPWLAALIFKPAKDSGNGYFCAGTLIAPKWVLTAAHCLQRPIRPQSTEVVVGRYDLTSAEGQTIQVENFYIHADFSAATLIDSDVALIELAEPATVGAFLPPIAEATLALAEAGDMGRTVGWGLLRFLDNNAPNIPYGVDMPITTEAACRAGYEGDALIGADNICAGYLQGQASSCQGDSGSALIVRSDDGSAAYQAGIVSAGAGCGWISKYTIYTRVSEYNAWVSRALNGTFSADDTIVVGSSSTIPNNFLGFTLTELPFGFKFIDGFADRFEMFLEYANDDGRSLILGAFNDDIESLDEIAGGPIEEVVEADELFVIDGVQVVIIDDFTTQAIWVQDGIVVLLDGEVSLDQMKTLVSTVIQNTK